jgi:antitoxin HigA-1
MTPHPGAHLRTDVLPRFKVSKAEIARRAGISRQTLYDILNEKQALTAPKLFGLDAHALLTMQRTRDLELAQLSDRNTSQSPSGVAQ